MAGYSIVTYLLAIKDRHNGNIMLNNEGAATTNIIYYNFCRFVLISYFKGNIIHIDFGFVFGLAPGKQFSMETAPWKLTDELLGVMSNGQGDLISQYKRLCTAALSAARKHHQRLLSVMEIMSYNSNFPSFKYNKNAIIGLKERLLLNVSEDQLAGEVEKLFSRSVSHSGTFAYDQFQLMTNGIAV
jgi:phosphatidylinositol 4-kinase